MNGEVVEIPRIDAEKQRVLNLDRGFAEALAEYARRRWPDSAAKAAAREWGLTMDQARELVRGNASKTSIEKAFKRGGLALALPIVEEVTGQSVARYLYELGASHENHGRRLVALAGDLWPRGHSRRDDPADSGSPRSDRGRSLDRRVG